MTDSSTELWVGVDLGGTKMLATAYDGNFTQLGSQRTKTKGFEGQQAGVKRLVKTIEESLAEAKRSSGELEGIGIACPGPIDLAKGVLISAPNLGWENVTVKKTLEAHFKCPIVLLNDVDSGVYGEYHFGAGKMARCVVGVFPGTGVGGGCVIDGRIHTGRNQTCFEIGHIPLIPDGPLCGCGHRGCLEAVASRLAIASQAIASAYRGDAPTLLEKSDLKLTKVRSGALRDSVAAGDKAIEAIIKQASEWIGVGVATVVHLLAPDVVVLGGGLVEAMPKLIRGTVEKTARGRVMPSFADSFEVTVAELGDDASVKGAAAWAKHELMTELTAKR